MAPASSPYRSQTFREWIAANDSSPQLGAAFERAAPLFERRTMDIEPASGLVDRNDTHEATHAGTHAGTHAATPANNPQSETSTGKKLRAHKRKIALHPTTHSVEIDGAHFPLAQLPAEQRAHFERKGYSIHLRDTDRDPAVEHRGLVEGTLSAFKLDPEADWIRAAAHAHAAAALKSAGVRLTPTQDPTVQPVFAAALERFNRHAASFSSTQKEAFRTDPDVVAWFARLTGAKKLDLAALVPADDGGARG